MRRDGVIDRRGDGGGWSAQDRSELRSRCHLSAIRMTSEHRLDSTLTIRDQHLPREPRGKVS